MKPGDTGSGYDAHALHTDSSQFDLGALTIIEHPPSAVSWFDDRLFGLSKCIAGFSPESFCKLSLVNLSLVTHVPPHCHPPPCSKPAASICSISKLCSLLPVLLCICWPICLWCSHIASVPFCVWLSPASSRRLEFKVIYLGNLPRFHREKLDFSPLCFSLGKGEANELPWAQHLRRLPFSAWRKCWLCKSQDPDRECLLKFCTIGSSLASPCSGPGFNISCIPLSWLHCRIYLLLCLPGWNVNSVGWKIMSYSLLQPQPLPLCLAHRKCL